MKNGRVVKAFYFGSQEPTSQQAEAMARGAEEMLTVFRHLAQKHGFQKAALACAQLNVANILEAMKKENVPDYLVAAAQQSFEHLLTQWGVFAKVPQEETLELVRGLREHMGILDTDLAEATKQGDSNGRTP